MSIELVLGGARSGKSRFAEQRIKQRCDMLPNVTKHYIATSEPLDDEMRARISHHRQQRGDGWIEWEVPVELVDTLSKFDKSDVVLVDCLTLWLNNVIYYLGESVNNDEIEQAVSKLADALSHSDAHIVLVSNEVGLGVVPLGEVSRMFVDNAGRMNQEIAKVSDSVTLVAAGLPLVLKGSER
ncbi:bifunctional adenosylcobinamide kinase/adenosylcobinamide-phosphate guanylyltransferase [Vibrio sp. SCSIO 43140]|uniref:bifunctional adenosylcobinamide kinase/adenosylcobinamide-phosphate guanylyltransferase n=1 Tax=Vibrio sp. SCSIO 43140 TaxID=2819100 RepID=UPI002075D851|nr:bifunctional adenosylcobinamide kinase/adenosylcobinamide-phosphate guanylyltransferase [Vibrio sp. SCSIO 43140]USD58765.1 bifunctional adenosylcobinamide kinase/adenosylcobinamide-phosphate guanylyltransferase [Vibrio sp. SCSIO 43140]